MAQRKRAGLITPRSDVQTISPVLGSTIYPWSNTKNGIKYSNEQSQFFRTFSIRKLYSYNNIDIITMEEYKTKIYTRIATKRYYEKNKELISNKNNTKAFHNKMLNQLRNAEFKMDDAPKILTKIAKYKKYRNCPEIREHYRNRIELILECLSIEIREDLSLLLLFP